jgi:hypothetical protein
MGSTDKAAKLTTDTEDKDTKNVKTPKHEDDVPQTESVKPKVRPYVVKLSRAVKELTIPFYSYFLW